MSDDGTLPSLDIRLKQRAAMLDSTSTSSSQSSSNGPGRPMKAFDLTPTVSGTQPHGTIPNTVGAVSLISFLLGGLFFVSFSLFSSQCGEVFLDSRGLQTPGRSWWWTTPQLCFFLAAWSGFHWGEFIVTAGWNREKCTVDSFLLDNGMLYHIAHGTALSEYLLSLYLRPSWKAFPYISVIGIAVVVAGQTLRSMAMIHASTNFSHAVAFRKAEKHRLVTDGIYAWFRHPSYAGFFYWALGTQLVLQNPISFVLYSILLWRFFYYRVKAEEAALIRFFGDNYVQYRRRVGTMIPFVP